MLLPTTLSDNAEEGIRMQISADHHAGQNAQLEAWLWATPNSRRISILFAELGLDYRVHPVNIRQREQFAPEILALNPYGKLPIVRWRDAGGTHVLAESGAIMLHFADSAPQLLPQAGPDRDLVLQWFFFAMTSLGPMTGQAHHWCFLTPEPAPAAAAHAVAQVRRAYAVLEAQLDQTGRGLCGDFSLADVAAYPWVAEHGWARIELADYPATARWLDRVARRDSVAQGMAVPAGARLEG